MNELALFAGAGGGILGGKLLGWRTVCAVERDAYAAQVLAQRQNDGLLAPFPIWSDVCSFDGKPWRGIIDVISGGFPCQDISAAGKGAGITGARSGLWKEFDRIVGEVEPRCVYVENSPILTIRGLGVVLGDLAERGFDAEWGVLSAAAAGAPHKRERIWIMAHSNSAEWREVNVERNGSKRRLHIIGAKTPDRARKCCEVLGDTGRDRRQEGRIDYGENDGSIAPADGQYTFAMADSKSINEGGLSKRTGETHPRFMCCGQDLADPMCPGLQTSRQEQGGEDRWDARGGLTAGGWWGAEPDVGRVANGVAARVDRLKAIGNGQVPAVAAAAWQMLSHRGLK